MSICFELRFRDCSFNPSQGIGFEVIVCLLPLPRQLEQHYWDVLNARSCFRFAGIRGNRNSGWRAFPREANLGACGNRRSWGRVVTSTENKDRLCSRGVGSAGSCESGASCLLLTRCAMNSTETIRCRDYEIEFANSLFLPIPLSMCLTDRRAAPILFDLGQVDNLSPKQILKLTHVLVSHMHLDHFYGFDRCCVPFLRMRSEFTFCGPEGLGVCIRIGCDPTPGT